MLHKIKVIVLHTLKFGESGIIVNAYSDTYGRQSYLVQGVRKRKSRINANFFQPLSLLDLEVYFKENRELQHIREVKLASSPVLIHFDIRRSTIALFLSEFLYRTLRETEPNPKLFDFLFHAIQILEITEEGLENFHLAFLMQFTKFIGIFPGDDSILQQFKKEQKNELVSLIDCSLTDIGKFKLSNSARFEVLNQLIEFYKTHLEDIGQINSLKILHEVFH
jgi:DNA repair protein RecO (recombination protein O)